MAAQKESVWKKFRAGGSGSPSAMLKLAPMVPINEEGAAFPGKLAASPTDKMRSRSGPGCHYRGKPQPRRHICVDLCSSVAKKEFLRCVRTLAARTRRQSAVATGKRRVVASLTPPPKRFGAQEAAEALLRLDCQLMIHADRARWLAAPSDGCNASTTHVIRIFFV